MSAETAPRLHTGAVRDAVAFLFPPDQCVEDNDDGPVTACFKVGGIDEVRWPLFTRGRACRSRSPLISAGG